MDIKMPSISGYTATKQIREFNKDVIIIAQTAYALIGDREKAMDIYNRLKEINSDVADKILQVIEGDQL